MAIAYLDAIANGLTDGAVAHLALAESLFCVPALGDLALELCSALLELCHQNIVFVGAADLRGKTAEQLFLLSAESADRLREDMASSPLWFSQPSHVEVMTYVEFARDSL